MTDTSTNRPILSMSKTEYFYCLNLFWMFSLLFVILYFVLFCSVLFLLFLFVLFLFVFFGKIYLRRWMQEKLRKTRQRVSLSYFYSLKICFKFIRFCTLCLLACRTISEQFIFFFIFKVLSMHFQNSFILIFCHRPIILYFINFYKKLYCYSGSLFRVSCLRANCQKQTTEVINIILKPPG